jgi:hypothetical protein
VILELLVDESTLGYFQQDGVTRHSAKTTIAMLREFFDNRLISRNTANIWSPRSCDLTSADFFLWPHLKNSIYQTPVHDLQELKLRITEKVNKINNNPGTSMLRNVIRGVRRRAHLCLEQHGEHFQHLLYSRPRNIVILWT